MLSTAHAYAFYPLSDFGNIFVMACALGSVTNATIAQSPNVTQMYPVNDETIKLAMMHLMDTFGAVQRA
jgi:hypothetical protein